MPRLPPDSAFSPYSRQEIERLCFANVLANPEEAAYFKDRQSRFVLVSPAWLVWHRTTLEEAIGKTDFDFFPEAHAAAAFADEQQVIETGQPILKLLEREIVRGGADKWYAAIKLPLRDTAGNIIGTWGVTREITAQREAELALHASELQYRALFEHNPQPMMAYTRDGWRIVAVSNACVEAYGYTREEFLQMTVHDLVPPEDSAVLQRPPSTGFIDSLQSRHRYKDGTLIDVEVTSDNLVLDGQECRIALCLNVTERNRTLAELAIARDEAVEASNMKSAFLANMSHEIRTPMAGVLGMADLLLDSRLDDDQRSLVEHLSRSGELMVELINDILDVSKIEAGQLTLEAVDFPLCETIEQACASASARLQAKGVEFDLQFADEVPQQVRGDGQRLRQIVLNLVSNAVKFTDQGSVTVRVRARPRQGADLDIRIEVADTGIGIEPSILNRMFEPFTQADASTTRHYGGTGLGLAIARELTGMMGGTIGAASKPGAGSNFWIDIPFAAPTTIAGEPGQPSQPVSNDTTWSTPPVVLVAEDNAINQIVAVRTLERCGCHVDVVADGHEALEALATHHYDAVLMDCQMPIMDGYEATIELRKHETGGNHTPVIAMTAHAMNGAIDKCLAAGMDDYIAKPMRRPQLVETLRRWIPPQSELPPAGDVA